jgi:hypothetical protein
LSIEIGIFGLIVLVSCCVAAGVCGALIHTWNLKALSYSLETRVATVEGILTREVKARAGQERWKKPDKDLELLKAAQTLPTGRVPNWWEKTQAS